ncbi:MAG TPA: DUF4089 domain-containing protein [Burkholderiales bacterium]|nr:DUF4089 domain-containing protein [Burkholderiales bacterium]
MIPDADTLRAQMQSSAALLQLSISSAQEPGVMQNLQRIAALAALVNEFVLDESVEPAPVFRHE